MIEEPAAPTTGRPATVLEEGETLAVGFVRVLRNAGIAVPISSTVSFAEALQLVGVEDRDSVYWSGRSTLLHHPEDIPLYDHAFRLFFDRRAVGLTQTEAPPPPPTTLLLDSESEDDEDDSSQEAPEGDVETVRFSRVEILTEKDFSQCTDEELAELSSMMSTLKFVTFKRRSRRQAKTKKQSGRPDLARTVRAALRSHGEPLQRAFTQPASRPRRIIFILDVSGSMESYARALIRFVHASLISRGRVEVFTIGTRLSRLTRQLSNRDPDAALASAAPEVRDWAGGTRLGEALGRFNDEWGVRGMGRGAVVVILSDGWDRGDAAVLGEQMERLHRVTHKLIWVNPLKATPGYEPLAAGMAAALPHVDTFVSGNNFGSLQQLAQILQGVDD